MRDLRNHGGHVIDRVARGERVTITRDGKPVAELRPFVHSRVSSEALLERWRQLPTIDAALWRQDLDEVIDSKL